MLALSAGSALFVVPLLAVAQTSSGQTEQRENSAVS